MNTTDEGNCPTFVTDAGCHAWDGVSLENCQEYLDGDETAGRRSPVVGRFVELIGEVLAFGARA